MKKISTKQHRTSKARLSSFAASLLREWQRLKLPFSDATVVVAVSGGADSSALLLALDELITREKLALTLVVAHLDHGLREDSRSDAVWVSELAKSLAYGLVSGRANLKKGLKPGTDKPERNLEQAARDARYEFLRKTAVKKHSTLVLTAHTQDDQAETILMRLLRGSSAEGLSGTSPVRLLTASSNVMLVRPLIAWARRADTEAYCTQRHVDFRVDEMNHDQTFSRVRIRKQLLPLMKSFNNRIVEALNRTAVLLNEDAVALSDAAKQLLDRAGAGSIAGPAENSETYTQTLSVSVMSQAPAAVRRRALREWIARARGDLRRIEMIHLVAVEKLLDGERGGRVAELPGGMKVTLRRGVLELSGRKGLKKGAATSKIPRR